MSSNLSRKRNKSYLKLNTILILCFLFLGLAMLSNYISKSYINKNLELAEKIKTAQSETSKIETENKSIENSISELDKQIEAIKKELN